MRSESTELRSAEDQGRLSAGLDVSACPGSGAWMAAGKCLSLHLGPRAPDPPQGPWWDPDGDF